MSFDRRCVLSMHCPRFRMPLLSLGTHSQSSVCHAWWLLQDVAVLVCALPYRCVVGVTPHTVSVPSSTGASGSTRSSSKTFVASETLLRLVVLLRVLALVLGLRDCGNTRGMRFPHTYHTRGRIPGQGY